MKTNKLFERLYNVAGIDKDNINVKLTQKNPYKSKSHFAPFSENNEIQADLIYMPIDKGYKYILTVVDIASKVIDAQPLKDRSSDDVIYGFDKIFSRKT